MTTRIYRVYGAESHRQRVSFQPSCEFTTYKGGHIVERNADQTGTNDYTELVITAATEKHCFSELYGQLYDGIFENARRGDITEVVEGVEAYRIEIHSIDGSDTEIRVPIRKED